ncbi:MAG TPA: hypothetical protein VFI31_26500 [Pirellulales bacterium]|nr:hypothetical protein [Pirellulales bacterium]
MAMTFDATLKDLARECPLGVLAEFDEPPDGPVKLLNVDLAAVSKAADLVLGLGEPLDEIVHVEFQSSAAAWKHADLVLYNALLFSQQHVPVHTILVLLRPQAAHPNADGRVQYSPRPGRGKMDFGYQVIRLWERPAEQLLTGELGLTPLAMLGQLAEGTTVEDGLAVVVQRLVERLTQEAEPARATKLLTSALLLTGLRVDRHAALNIFRGVHMLEESDTYLMILEQGEERGKEHTRRGDILVVGEERLGAADEPVRMELEKVKDVERLKRMLRKAATAASWQEVIETP